MRVSSFKKIVGVVGLGFVCFVSTGAHAGISKTTICDSCVSPDNFRAAAEQGAQSIPLVSVYVANTNSEQLRKFYLSKQRDRITGNFGPYRITEQSVESERLADFYEYLAARDNLLSYLARGITIPADIATSAWDMVGASAVKNNVIDYYQNNQSTSQYLAEYVSAATTAFGSIIHLNASVSISVAFEDGSTADFRIEGFNSDGTTIALGLLSAKDSLNNDIPFRATAMQSSYIVSSGGTVNGAHVQTVDRALVRLASGGTGGICYGTSFTCDGKGHCFLALRRVTC